MSFEGEGDNTTLGIRVCFPGRGRALTSSDPERDENGPLTETSAAGIGLGVAISGDDVGAVGSQSKPGFIIRFTVSPSLMFVYSLSNFVSARAFPLRRRRWASAGGAEG